MNQRKYLVLNNFALKFIAIVTMTLDHIGCFMQMYFGGSILATVFRCIGRLSLPLFCFLIAEGMIHTSNKNKYLSRLGLFSIIVSAGMAVIYHVSFFQDYGVYIGQVGNAFIGLFLGALGIYFLQSENKLIKALVILPIAYGVLSFGISLYEYGTSTLVYWFPAYVRSQTGWYPVLLIIGCYLAHPLKDYYLSKTGLEKDALKDTDYERNLLNLLTLCIIIIITLLLYSFKYIVDYSYIYWDEEIQNIAMISGAFILLYNGKRGYNAKWFKIGCYIYYPLHLIIIGLIFVAIYIS